MISHVNLAPYISTNSKFLYKKYIYNHISEQACFLSAELVLIGFEPGTYDSELMLLPTLQLFDFRSN